jgi:hypothetical protein
MPTNIPVRLVRKDGGLIPLNVTTLTLDVDRSINPHTIPFAGGERFAFDLNMAKAVILLEGIITDDDLVSVELGRAAEASIDFSSRRVGGYRHGAVSLIGDGGGMDLATLGNAMTADSFTDIDMPVLTLKDGNLDFKINFIKSSTAHGNNLAGTPAGEYHIAIHDNTDMNTAVEIATNLRDLINSSVNANALSSRFTASLAKSTYTDEDDTVVKIVKNTVGKAGNSNTPSFKAATHHTPIHKSFRNGRDSGSEFTSMSAGDKVMSLYATLNNSNDGGLGRSSKRNKSTLVREQQKNMSGYQLKYGDYVIGIQIPFNSTVGSTTGDKYTAKNFFMPTGPLHNQNTKHPNQAEAASTEVANTNDNDDKAFIKGAVTKATFVQLGGEPIYQFNIQFIPVDYLI